MLEMVKSVSSLSIYALAAVTSHGLTRAHYGGFAGFVHLVAIAIIGAIGFLAIMQVLYWLSKTNL